MLSQSDFDRELRKEQAKAELWHNTLVLLLVGAGVLSFNTTFFASMLAHDAPPRARLFDREDWLVIMPVFLLILGWFAIARKAIRKHLGEGKSPPPYLRAVSAFVEMLLATIPLLLGAFRDHDPSYGLITPWAWVYFPFVVVSTVRLDWKLCILTATWGAAQYALVLFCMHYRGGSLWLPIEAAKLSILLITGAGAAGIAHYIQEQSRQTVERLLKESRLRALFGQHVSPKVAEAIERTTLDQETRSRKICVMFLDIRGFTSFSEGKNPEEVVRYLNTLFAFMVDVIDRRQGVVNKFLGDGFMAVFGAPIAIEDPCLEAVEAAREIVARVEELVATRMIPPTGIGLGLHFGEALTGFVGTESRREYTVIGDVVNVAARVESLNKELGSSLLVSEEVLQALPARPPEAVAKGPVPVKGRKQPVTVWQLS